MGSSWDLPDVDRFVTGALGPPGARIFYLQVVASSEVVTLRLEKQQVALLAEHLDRLLATYSLPEVAPAHMAELVEPVQEQWTIGSLMVAVNEAAGRLVVIAEELTETEDDPGAGEARISLTRDQVEAFVDGARRVVLAGRPTCRLCGAPMDPEGHACPRWN